MSTIINPQPQFQMEEVIMSQPQNEKQQEVQQINPIVLLKQPDLYKQTFIKIIKNGQQLFRSKDLQKGLVYYDKALDMLDLGKNILKDHVSKYLKLTIFANLAYGYQSLRKLQKSNRFCQRTKEQLQRLILSAKDQENCVQRYLKLSKFLVTMKFQHCAIVSQLEQHEKALQMCKSTLPELKQQIQTMLRYLRENPTSKLLQRKTGQTVQFYRQVQNFAETLLVDLLGFLNQPLKRFHFYHWEKNPQLNQQQVRKKFIPSGVQARNTCKRSILGVSKTSSWMDQFNIGSIMHMSMVTVQEFQVNLPMEEYFFRDKLYEIVILCSLSYFTMATQIRFIQPSKQRQSSQKQAQANNPSNIPQNAQNAQSNIQFEQAKQCGSKSLQSQGDPAKLQSAQVILKKYGYGQRSQLHKLSELYHLRSIEILSKHIQSVIPYLIHIIKSYDKHYLKKKQLQPIAAINQQSQMSLLNQSVRQYLPEDKVYNDYMKKENQTNINDQAMDQLLLQSQDNHSFAISRIRSVQRNSQFKNQDLGGVKNASDFHSVKEYQKLSCYQSDNLLKVNSNKYRKNLSKIAQEQKPISQINLQARTHQNQDSNHQNPIYSGQYLRSKRQIKNIKSPGKNKNPQTKGAKSKSKLNLIKSGEKQSLSTYMKNQKSSRKNIYTYRSPDEQKRPVSKSHSQNNKVLAFCSTQQGIAIKQCHDPEFDTINESKNRFKNHLSDKTRQKLLKKFVGVPNSHQKNDNPINSKKTKNNEKRTGHKQGQKKKQSKYFSTFDGQKQYRIKHESTTHIKVLYKKKNVQQDNLNEN